MNDNVIDIHRNDQIYNMIAEGEVANILAHYNSDYVMNLIEDNIKNRFKYNILLANPNIVYSFEMNFKDLMERYPSDVENIMQVREERYSDIISLICNSFNLSYIADTSIDLYNIAYNLYDFLVAKFSQNVVVFFSRFIYQNQDQLYDALDLQRYKKDKNSSISYIKKVYDNSKMAVIISRIYDVIYFISGMNIPMEVFLSYCYPIEMVNFFTSIIAPNGDLIKDSFRLIESPELMSDIRLELQQIIKNDISGKDDNNESGQNV